MSTANSTSQHASIDLDIDLPASDAAAASKVAAQPRPPIDVKDTGRILFGASCRMPLQK
jgi:hypothetical protein